MSQPCMVKFLGADGVKWPPLSAGCVIAGCRTGVHLTPGVTSYTGGSRMGPGLTLLCLSRL